MLKAIDYIFAARPLLHLPVWSVYLVTLGAMQMPDANYHPGAHIQIMAGLSLVVAGAYYLNQIFDYESDRINDKLGFLQKGLASMRTFWWLFAVTSIAGLTVVTIASPRLLILVGLQFLLGVAYSVPKLKFKDRPRLGLLTNAFSFGLLVPAVALAASMPGESLVGCLEHPLPIYFYLAVAAIHIMTTLPDREGDAAAGKRTVAVIVSPGVCRFFAAVLLAGAGFVAYWAKLEILTTVAIISFGIVLTSYFMKSDKLDLLAAKLPLLLLTFLAGWTYPYYAAFVVALVFATRVYYRRRFGITYPKLA
jgi:4-hydroxybenzoate polyprenyltransferase